MAKVYEYSRKRRPVANELQGARRKRRDRFGYIVFGIAACVFGGALMIDDVSPFGPQASALGGHSIRVIDGDTIDVNGERIRISNLDAPEMRGRAKCPAEAQLAIVAKGVLESAIAEDPAKVELFRQETRPEDRYGRTLARVFVDGVDVAETMIAAGVARPWRGRSSDWCGL